MGDGPGYRLLPCSGQKLKPERPSDLPQGRFFERPSKFYQISGKRRASPKTLRHSTLTLQQRSVVSMFQSVLSLDSSGRNEALEFLKNCALNFGLAIPSEKESCEESSNVLHQSEVKNDSSSSITGNSETSTFKGNEDEKLSSESVTLDKDFKSDSRGQQFLKNCPKSECLVKTDSISKIFSKRENFPQSENNKKKKNGNNNSFKKTGKEKKNKSDECSKVRKKSIERKKVEKKTESVKGRSSENKNGIFKCPACTVVCDSKSSLFVHFTSHSDVPMSCRLCRINFNDVIHFWTHQNKKECKVTLFKCTECGEKFKYRRHYLKHILGHNDNNCRYCDEKFSTWILYKHHLKEKHPDIKTERDLIPCKFCAMGFRRHLGLYNHYQVEHSKGKFVCLSCGILLPTKEKYKEHALVHESEKSWKCRICKMKFYRRQQLLFHVSVHKSGTYKCLTCKITVTSKTNLYKHQKEGHEVKGLEAKFECEICHKSFKKKVVLKNHMATHSSEKQYYCKYCVKSFSTLDALQKHKKRKSHFEKAKIILPESKYEKVYEDKLICENCGKQYKTQRELTWHLRVHKSIYECDECGKTFTLKVNLTKHIKLHRNKNCVICELCGNTFNQLSALNEHILMKHSDIRNAECEVCKKKFKRKSELNRHKRIHEQKRPFVCFCGTAFNQSSHLQTHFRNFHEKATEQTNLIQSNEFPIEETADVFSNAVSDGRKVFVNNESETLLSLETVEPEFRSTDSYDASQENERDVGKPSYVNTYNLRYPQNDMDQMNVAYDDLNFENSQSDKRGLVFSSPAVDLSMVAISEVVQNDITLGSHRDLAESVEPYNKMPDDSSSLQLVNLSDHIVQEYLLNLP